MAALASRLTVAVALAFVIQGYYAQTTCEDPQTYVKSYALISIPHRLIFLCKLQSLLYNGQSITGLHRLLQAVIF